MSDQRPLRLLAGALVLLVAWRFLAGLDAHLNRSIDDAQYFRWSQAPAWGYFSKPPLIAWTIALSTSLCGESETCIRLPALLLFAASAWILALLASRLYDARTGMWAGLVFASLGLNNFYSWVMTTDSLLLFFWSLSLLLFHQALQQDRWRDWLLAGTAIGLGLLAKYSMGLFLACALALLWIGHRDRLRSPRPWLAALWAMSFLIPNLLWNLDHQFATLRHTAEISQLDRKLFHPDSLLDFVLAQFIVMGPLLLPVLVLSAADRPPLKQDPGQRLLALFSLPVLGLFIALSLLSRAHANWAAPAYAAAALLAVTWLLRRGLRRWLVAAIALNLFLAGVLYHWHRIAPAIGIELRKGTDPFHPLRGWEEAGRQLADRMREAGCHAVIASDRATLVELAYYARRASGQAVEALAYNPQGLIRNHFELTADIAHRPFSCALLVGSHNPGTLQEQFSEVRPLEPIRHPKDEGAPVPVLRVSGFRGYAAGSGGAAGR